jgi:hypothetical protein
MKQNNEFIPALIVFLGFLAIVTCYKAFVYKPEPKITCNKELDNTEFCYFYRKNK